MVRWSLYNSLLKNTKKIFQGMTYCLLNEKLVSMVQIVVYVTLYCVNYAIRLHKNEVKFVLINFM